MHFYLLLVSSSKGSFGEESLEIGLLPLIWGRGTHEKDQISLAGMGRWVVVVWEEGGGSKEGLLKVYGRGDNSGEPAGQGSASAFRDSGAIEILHKKGRAISDPTSVVWQLNVVLKSV